MGNRLRAAPDQKEQRLAAPAAGGMADDVARSLGGGRAPLAWRAARGCSRDAQVFAACRPCCPRPAPSRVCAGLVLRRVAARRPARADPRAARLRSPRYRSRRAARPIAKVDVCSPPVPAPMPSAITFSAGPANSHSRAIANLAQIARRRCGWPRGRPAAPAVGDDARQIGRQATRICRPSSSVAPVTIVLGMVAAGDPGAECRRARSRRRSRPRPAPAGPGAGGWSSDARCRPSQTLARDQGGSNRLLRGVVAAGDPLAGAGALREDERGGQAGLRSDASSRG